MKKEFRLNKWKVLGMIFCSILLILGSLVCVYAQDSTLRILMFSSFVPQNDEALKAIGAEFGREKGIKVEVDFVSIKDMYPKLVAQADSKSGHDIIGLENLLPITYKGSLLNLDDIIEEIIAQYGPFANIAKEISYQDGHWKSLPWWIVPFHSTYRMDYFKDVGEQVPRTWEDLLRAGKKLKAIGHPIGIALSATGDSNNALYQIMWGFGARTADSNGVVAINSPETRKALTYVKELYEKTMIPDVLTWDNGGNNRYILSGVGSWTMNPISVWVIAKRDFPELAEQLNHYGAQYGPMGRHGAGDFYSLGIWDFSPNKALAKEFLLYLYKKDVMNSYLESGQGFNLATHPYFYEHFVFQRNPKISELIGYAEWMHYTGWPAPADKRAQEVYLRWIVPNMFTEVATGTFSMDQAISKAEKELIEIGYKPAK
ncbi:hypothetical protein ES705_21494 [subsurface metagenome]